MPCCMLTIPLLMLVPEKPFYQKPNQSKESTLIIRVNHLLGGQGPDFVHFSDSKFELQTTKLLKLSRPTS